MAAARRLGADPAEAFVVEDAPPGIEAAKAAGMAAVALPSHARPGGARGGLTWCWSRSRSCRGSGGLSFDAGFSARTAALKGELPSAIRVYRGKLTERPAAHVGFEPMDGDGPRFGAMIGLVAVVVAT